MRKTHHQAGSILKWVLAIIALLAILLVAWVMYVRANPLAVYKKTTRRALARAGLELASFDSSVGRLVYWEAGEGPTLVLLHGAGDQSGAFQAIVSGLLAEYRLLIPDIPGHGDSEPAEGNLKMTTMYAGIAEFLAAKAGDEPSILIGSSMGAWIATIHAHRQPQAVAWIIAINGGPLVGNRPDLSLTPPDREAARRLMQALRDPASEPWPDYLLDDIVEQSAKGPIGRMTAEFFDLTAHLLEGKLDEVEVPVDLIWGESDQLLSLAYAGRMHDQLPRSRLTTIAGCGHHPANECPAKLAVTLGEVLKMGPPPLPLLPLLPIKQPDTGSEATQEQATE